MRPHESRVDSVADLTRRRDVDAVRSRTPRCGPKVVVLLVAVLALAGCSQTPPAQHEVGGGSSDWEQFHAEYPNAPRPDTQVIRNVDLDEWATVIADCLHDAGFPNVHADSDGGLSYETPPQQAEPFGLAKYVCMAQYPLDPKYTKPATDEQLGKLYDYLTLVQVPCLEAQGLEVPPPPSKTRFIETYYDSPEWLPFAMVSEQAEANGTLDQLDRLCPQTPPVGSEYYLY